MKNQNRYSGLYIDLSFPDKLKQNMSGFLLPSMPHSRRRKPRDSIDKELIKLSTENKLQEFTTEGFHAGMNYKAVPAFLHLWPRRPPHKEFKW